MDEAGFEVEETLQALYAAIELRLDGRWAAGFQGLQLSSHFQPVFSFPHGRPVGHEALIRAVDAHGVAVPPIALFERARSFQEQVQLDRLCRLLHVHNFCAQPENAGGWLFLNIHPAVFLHSAQQSELLTRAVQLLHELGMPMERLVIEVTEDVMARDQAFEEAVAWSRSAGCLLALDDFGAGHSNFDRVWRLRPDIVKLDRSLLQRARQSPRVARMMGQVVGLLHECSALTLLEGVETLDEAELALDADVDLVQGYAFGMPTPDLLDADQDSAEVAAVWQRFDLQRRRTQAQRTRLLAPYREAMEAMCMRLRDGVPPATAAAVLLGLPATRLVYRLDADGRELGERLGGRPGSRRFAPLERAGDARWARRPYFQRALEAPGQLQLSRPYLSMQGAALCVTLSLALPGPQGVEVVCVDVDWDEPL